MTALSRYERLEAPARLWTAAANDAQNVIVALGKTSLTISNMQGKPQDHWDLGSLVFNDQKEGGCTVRPAPGTDDILQVSDPDLTKALSVVVAASERARRVPKRRRSLRWGLGSLVVAGGVTLAAALVLKANLAHWMGPGQKAELAAATLAAHSVDLCATPQTDPVLKTLSQHLDVGILINRDQAAPLLALPDNRVVFSGTVLQGLESPEALAGVALAARTHLATRPAIQTLVDAMPLQDTVLLVMGRSSKAQPFITIETDPSVAPAIAFQLQKKGVSATQAIAGLNAVGFSALASPISALSGQTENAALVVPDGAWLAFQARCEPSA